MFAELVRNGTPADLPVEAGTAVVVTADAMISN